MAKITLFAQVIQKLPKELIKSLAKKHGTDKYAKPIRRIAVYNTLHHFTMVLLTNNMTLAAGTIAYLYKARWDIEILPQPQTELPHQELCRHLAQRSGDTDMDGTHHHTAFCRSQAAGNLQMALLEPRLVAQAQHFYENRHLPVDKRAFHSSARDGK